MNILVTGCAGFIGSHFLKYVFKNTDWKIFGLDSITYAGQLENIGDEILENYRFKFIYDSIQNVQIVDKLMSKCDYCVHFAGATDVNRSIENADDFIDTNVGGTKNILDALRKYNLKRLIYISTSEVYGAVKIDPMTESHPLDPRSPYAATKCSADRLCQSYITTFDVPITIIRPFNNYGPNQHPEKLIPGVITSILQGKPGRIYGSGQAERDWLFVKDNVRGIFEAMITDVAHQKIINLATNESHSVNEVVDIIIQKIGGSVEHIDARPGEVSAHRGSYDLAKTMLDWSPKVNLESGIEQTINWYNQNQDWWKSKRIQFGCKLVE